MLIWKFETKRPRNKHIWIQLATCKDIKHSHLFWTGVTLFCTQMCSKYVFHYECWCCNHVFCVHFSVTVVKGTKLFWVREPSTFVEVVKELPVSRFLQNYWYLKMHLTLSFFGCRQHLVHLQCPRWVEYSWLWPHTTFDTLSPVAESWTIVFDNLPSQLTFNSILVHLTLCWITLDCISCGIRQQKQPIC